MDSIDVKKLLESADRYMKKSDWKDLAMIKLCLCSVGVIAGSFIPSKHKKGVRVGASCVFAVTYAALMTKYAAVVLEGEEKPQE